jgi:transposase
MISSRQVERACQENIIFIALSYGYAPDHSTIAHFISSMQSELESLFCKVLLVCEELGLLDGTHFSAEPWKPFSRNRNGQILPGEILNPCLSL